MNREATAASQRAFSLGMGVALLVEAASLLPLLSWRPFLEDAYRALLGPFLYACPLVFLGLAIRRGRDGLTLGMIDLCFGAAMLLSLVSFLAVNRGFTPFNPIYTDFSVFVLYLMFRTAWGPWLRPRLQEIFAGVIGLVSVEATHGLVGAAWRLKSDTHMLNENFLGMLCALTVPLWLSLLRAGFHRTPGWGFRILFWAAGAAVAGAIYVTQCRSAWLALIVVVPFVILLSWHPRSVTRLRAWPAPRKLALAAGLVLPLIPLAWWLYQIRPVSVQGRLLLWRVSFSIFSDHPFVGVGFGQLPRYLGMYHAQFFEEGTATLTERMLPSLFFDSFNEYLRVAAEYGLVGLAVWLPLWASILVAAGRPLRHAAQLDWESAGSQAAGRHPFTLGLAGLVLVYLILAFFYFPGGIEMFAVLFVFAVAGLVSERSMGNPEAGGGR